MAPYEAGRRIIAESLIDQQKRIAAERIGQAWDRMWLNEQRQRYMIGAPSETRYDVEYQPLQKYDGFRNVGWVNADPITFNIAPSHTMHGYMYGNGGTTVKKRIILFVDPSTSKVRTIALGFRQADEEAITEWAESGDAALSLDCDPNEIEIRWITVPNGKAAE